MKKVTTLYGAAALAAIIFGSGPARAANEAGGSIGVFSRYVWRGQTLSEGAVVQTGTGVSTSGLSLDLWSTYDTDLEELNETDVTVSYAFEAGPAAIEAGFIYYGLDGFPDTEELYLGVGLDTTLAPSLTLYWDIDVGNGGFLTAAVGHTFDVTDDIGIDLGVGAGMNLGNAVMGAGEDGDDFTGLYNGEVTLSASIPLADTVSIEPLAAYSFPLGSDAKAAIEAASADGESSVFSGGLTVAVGF